MLIQIERIKRVGASDPPIIEPIGINPATLESVEALVEFGVDGPCVLITTMTDEKIRARGTVSAIIAATQGQLEWHEPADTDTD